MATTTSADRALHLSGERLPFAMLPRWLLYHADVNEGAKFLYCVLHDLVSGKQGPTRPVTRAELAASCGVSVDTIDRRLAQLVAAGAVEKQAQIRAGGQQANIYMVWLTPPDGLHRSDEHAGGPGSRNSAAPVEGSANGPAARSRESAAAPYEPHERGSTGRAGAAPMWKEEQEEIPPQPPRTAGGQDEFESGKAATTGRRSSRAAGTNPRSEADRAEAARLEAEAARRQAELEARTEARRTADLNAKREAERLEAEALAISAALDDAALCAVVTLVGAGLSGLLAGSTVAVTRAVVAWCRTATATHPGPFTTAVAAALAEGVAAGEGSAPLDLPPAPAGTAALRTRIAAILKAGAPV
jgi:hypothetical protein